MTALVPVPRREIGFTPAQLHLMQRTVAKDCDPVEFDHFMAVAAGLGLNPLRKQICAIVYNKHDPKKRNMSIIVQIDGFRLIAARSGAYRPMDAAPEILTREDLRSEINPLGIERAIARVWQRFGSEWFPVVGQARWDEFAPIEREWIVCDDGVRRPQGAAKLAANWARMPEHMIAKCAEAQALRRGWPDELSGVYTEEEMQRAQVIEAASDAVAEYEESERLRRVGISSHALMFVFDPAEPIESVERGKLADRLFRYLRDEAPSADAIDAFLVRNKVALQTFWAWDRAEALEVKRFAEQRAALLREQEGSAK